MGGRPGAGQALEDAGDQVQVHAADDVGVVLGQGVERAVGEGDRAVVGSRFEPVCLQDPQRGRSAGAGVVRTVAERGRAAGHTEVVADVLADNVPIRRLLAAVFPVLTCVDDDPEILRFVADLGAPIPLPRPRSETVMEQLTDIS
jgi:hypothetical protein